MWITLSRRPSFTLNGRDPEGGADVQLVAYLEPMEVSREHKSIVIGSCA